MGLIVKSNSVVVVVVLIILVTTNPCNAECNLAKIFRTPRDFDHMEIVERAGFDHTESTTPPPSSGNDSPPMKSTKKNGNNFANAQVQVMFGRDYESNHIMKIPPQVRNRIGMHHIPDIVPNHNFFYPPPQPYRTPPPCPSHQYYHPYPPPVPYLFPNYYFWSPREESKFLPPQLNEYFQRHPDFVVARYPYNEEVFVRGRPVRRREMDKVLIPEDIINGKVITDKLDILPNNLPPDLQPAQVIRSRLLRPADEENYAEKKEDRKRDCENQQKDNDMDIGNGISREICNSVEDFPYLEHNQKEKDDKNNLRKSESSKEDDEKETYNIAEPKVSETNAGDVQTQVYDVKYELNISEPSAQDEQRPINDVSGPNISESNSSDRPKPSGTLSELSSSESFKNELISELEQLLIESLVEYKCENNTDDSKMLLSYPITTKNNDMLNEESKQVKQGNPALNCNVSKQIKFANDIDSLKSMHTKDIVDNVNSCQCCNTTADVPTQESFLKDVDDLVAVMIEIIDTGDVMPATRKDVVPNYASFIQAIVPPIAKPYFFDDSIIFPDIISPFTPYLPKAPQPPPLSSIMDLVLRNYIAANSYPSFLGSQVPYGISQSKDNNSEIATTLSESKCLSSSADGYRSDPKTMVVYENSPEVKSLNFDQGLPDADPNIEAKEATLVAIPDLASRLNIDKSEDIIYLPQIKRISVEPTLRNIYSFPDTPASIKEENIMPRYISVIPEADFKVATSEDSHVVPAVISYSNIPAYMSSAQEPLLPDYCRKCGRKHSGGNYCDKCGYPLIFYPASTDTYCQSCAKETRQLNDW